MKEKVGRKRKITDEQIPHLVAEYARGRGANSIAKEFDVSPCTITKYLKQAGVTLRPAHPVRITTDAMLDIVEEMRARGEPWKRIEAKIGINTCTLMLHRRRRNSNG